MKKILLAIALLASTSLAVAQTAAAGSISGALAGSNSISGAQQGNAQTVNINGAPTPAVTSHQQSLNTSGTTRIETAPQVYAPPMGVTAPCRVAFSGGVSVVGVGVAGGGSVADDPCNLRELSRLYHGVGAAAKAVQVADAALALECNGSLEVARALGDLCPKRNAPVVTPQPVAEAEAEPIKLSKAPVCYETTDALGIRTTRCPN